MRELTVAKRLWEHFLWDKIESGVWRRSNRLFQALHSNWRTPESSDVWHNSRQFKKRVCSRSCGGGRWFHLQTLRIYPLSFNHNYDTVALISLIKIVLCSKFHYTKFINYKWLQMRLPSASKKSVSTSAPFFLMNPISHNVSIKRF